VIKKTLNPYWNESFDMSVTTLQMNSLKDIDNVYRRATEDSILAIQIFDQKKFKKKDQGFLGVINVRVGSALDLDVGGDGM
jgi:E3 ubiquitin-protein ligase NEDD4